MNNCVIKIVSVQQPHIRDSEEGEKRSLLEVNEHFRPTDNKVDGADERLLQIYKNLNTLLPRRLEYAHSKTFFSFCASSCCV
jgi:hypothetical protein